MTRLVDHEPRWLLPSQWSQQGAPFYIGVTFLCRCPRCVAGTCPTCGHHPEPRRLVARFWPPIDPEGLMQKYEWNADQMKANLGCAQAHQRVSGETFDTLTLAPSIAFEGIGHGHITNGECTP